MKYYCEAGHEVGYNKKLNEIDVCWICIELSAIKNPTKEDEERIKIKTRPTGKTI